MIKVVGAKSPGTKPTGHPSLSMVVARQKGFRAFFFRVHENLFCRTLFDNQPSVHEKDFVGNILRKTHLVRDDHHGRVLFRKRFNHAKDFTGKFRI